MLKLPRYDVDTVPFWYQVRMGWTDPMDLGSAVRQLCQVQSRAAFIKSLLGKR